MGPTDLQITDPVLAPRSVRYALRHRHEAGALGPALRRSVVTLGVTAARP